MLSHSIFSLQNQLGSELGLWAAKKKKKKEIELQLYLSGVLTHSFMSCPPLYCSLTANLQIYCCFHNRFMNSIKIKLIDRFWSFFLFHFYGTVREQNVSGEAF